MVREVFGLARRRRIYYALDIAIGVPPQGG
jgi:hypothetical protein